MAARLIRAVTCTCTGHLPVSVSTFFSVDVHVRKKTGTFQTTIINFSESCSVQIFSPPVWMLAYSKLHKSLHLKTCQGKGYAVGRGRDRGHCCTKIHEGYFFQRFLYCFNMHPVTFQLSNYSSGLIITIIIMIIIIIIIITIIIYRFSQG